MTAAATMVVKTGRSMETVAIFTSRLLRVGELLHGDAFAQASRRASDPTAQRVTSELATAFRQGGAQLQGYASQSAALATKRFKASLDVPGSVFMLTRAADGKGNVLLQIDKDNAQPRGRVGLGKDREPVYAVDDIAGVLSLRTTSRTLTGFRL